jgi:hypothetical protein
MPEYKTRPRPLLPNSFQIIIHLSSFHSRLYNLSYLKASLNKPQISREDRHTQIWRHHTSEFPCKIIHLHAVSGQISAEELWYAFGGDVKGSSVTRLRAERPGIDSRQSSGFYLRHDTQTGLATHSVRLYLSPAVKMPKRESDHSPPHISDVKYMEPYLHSPYVFMLCCAGKTHLSAKTKNNNTPKYLVQTKGRGRLLRGSNRLWSRDVMGRMLKLTRRFGRHYNPEDRNCSVCQMLDNF